MKRISLFLTDKEISAIKEISSDTGISMSEIIRRTIDKLINDERKKKNLGE